MSTFDTHGGYFSPQGYFKVNTGGSHDENPNGGVQIGIDPEGVPNMLEEGEPVYNDYVYSDNIKADKEILKKHGIPEKFGRMLYSDIADKYVDEAEERPNDPISNNGLNAMLVRLAEAQEEQKQIQKQKELEEELLQMSPEELAELEAMLSQQEQPQEEMVSPEAQIAPEQEMMQPEVPVMAKGGPLRNYPNRNPSNISEYLANAVGFVKSIPMTEAQRDSLEADRRIKENIMMLSEEPREDWWKLSPTWNTPFWNPEKRKPVSGYELLIEPIPQLSKIKSFISKDLPNTYKNGTDNLRRVRYNRVDWPTTNAYNGFYVPEGTLLDEPITPILEGTTASVAETEAESPYAEAARILWNNPTGLTLRPAYTGPVRPVSTANTFTITAPSILDTYSKRATTGVTSPADQISVDIPGGSSDSAKKTPAEQSAGRPNNGSMPTKEDAPAETASETPWDPDAVLADDTVSLLTPYNPVYKTNGDKMLDEVLHDEKARLGKLAKGNGNRAKMLPTWPRYSGAILSGLLGLHNAVQDPDKLILKGYRPVVPTSQMNLIDPVYHSMDTNMGINDLLASTGLTTYGLMQTAGPSGPQTLLAQDYNIGRNFGKVRTAYDDANYQRKNAVIAGINQNASALGNFHNAQNNVWANTMNDAQWKNIGLALQKQQYDNAAESAKYAAIQNQLDQIGEALSLIGYENANRNMINGDEAWDYGYGYGFDPTYKPIRRKKNGEGV